MHKSVIQPGAPWPYTGAQAAAAPAPAKAKAKPKAPRPTLVASSSDPIIGTLPPPVEPDAPVAPEVHPEPEPQKPESPAAPRKRSHHIDLADVVIEEGIRPPDPVRLIHKYDHLFEKMKIGGNILCPPEQMQSLRKSMMDWIKRVGRHRELRAYGLRRCPDGKSRVWLLKIQKPDKKTPGATDAS